MLTLALVGLSGCGGTTTYEWSQKITVVVSTPKGEVSGSSVQNIRAVKANKGFGDQPPGSEVYVTGEAVVVDLGETPNGPRFLFALMDNAAFIIPSLVAPKTGARTHEALKKGANLPLGERFTLSGSSLPLLVTFTDVSDPTSVREVKPADLRAHFGPGVRLKSITLEISDEPVSEGTVGVVLSWLSWSRDELLSRGSGRNPVKIQNGHLTVYIDKTDFRRGL